MRESNTFQETAMVNQKLTQYRKWRLWPVHAVAKLFGVLVKVDGFPFGSNRRCGNGAPESRGSTDSSSAECGSRLG